MLLSNLRKSFVSNCKFLLVGTVFLLTSARGVIHAQPVCTTDTLQNYINLPSGCTIDGFTFFDFTFAPPVTSGTPAASASNIDVTPSISAFGPSVEFSSSFFSISGNASASYGIDYGVDPGPVIGGESLSLDPPQGGVTVTQDYFPNTPPGCGDCPFFPLTVTPADPNASLTFPAPTSQVAVTTDIELSSTLAQPAGFDSFTNTTDLTSNAVPEPAAAALVTAGCAALLGFCRKRRRLFRN